MPLSPSELKALLECGVVHHQAGRPAEAVAQYEPAIAAGAGAPAHDLLGVALLDLGRTFDAEREFRKALVWEPSRTSSLGHLGNSLKARSRAGDAIVAYGRSLAVIDHDPLWLRNLGLAYLAAGAAGEAATIFRSLVGSRPDEARAHNDLGLAIAAMATPRQAVGVFRTAAALNPALPEVAMNLSSAGLAARDHLSAETWAMRAQAQVPKSPDVMNALAAVRLALDRPGDARTWLRRALPLKPDAGDAHYNLGLAEMAAAKLRAAEAAERRALAIRPSHAEAEWNLALIRLLAGDFVHGWQGYESRWRMRDFPTPLRPFPQPRWQGEPLAGRRILLHAEQGLGDTLQFIRYAPLVAERGGHVIVECQPPLRRLLARMESIREIRAQGEPLPAFDCNAALLSLPQIFGTTLTTIPRRIPYLSSPIEPDMPDQPTIGVVWAGSAEHQRDRARSLPTGVARSVAERLLTIPNANVVSLQLGPRARDLEDLIPSVLPSTGDFLDTAAKLASLRLVVTVDTAMVHLAGALGLHAVLILPFAPDFRWLLHRADSPWYPSLRLVRQKAPGDWGSTFALIENTVKGLLKG